MGNNHSGNEAQNNLGGSDEFPSPAQGRRVTMIVEAHSPEMFEWAMAQAFDMGRQMYIGIELSHKDDKTTRVKVRTTKLRRTPVTSEQKGTSPSR